MNKQAWEKELADRQRRHLASIGQEQGEHWQPCMHDTCQLCHGTGVKSNGQFCAHGISCPCPRCSPSCFSTQVTS